MLTNVPNMITVVIVHKTGFAVKVAIATVAGAIGFVFGAGCGVAAGQKMASEDAAAAQDQYEKTIQRVSKEADQDKETMRKYEQEVAEFRRSQTWTGK